MEENKVAKNNKKNKVQKFKKANIFIWIVYYFVCKILMFFKAHVKYGVNELKKRNKKEGAIVLFNHQTNHDHFICGAAAGMDRLTYIVSNYYMRNKTTNIILKLVRAIPKVQFRTDLISIRKMKRATDNGGLVTIAPAGQVSLHGETPYVDASIVKLLRFCKVDVYAFQITGGYLAFPKWRTNKKSRKVKMTVNTVKVLTKEEIASMSDEEIFERVYEAIDISDHLMQATSPVLVKNKHAIEGLENVLYVCPKCKCKNTYVSNGLEMKCCKCGNTIVMDSHAGIHPKTNDDICFPNESRWYEWQSELIKEAFLKEDFILENNFKLYSNIKDERVMEEVGMGRLTMTNHALYYDGTFNNEVIHKEFSFDILTQLPFKPGHHFEVPDGDGSFQFRPVDKDGIVVEWVQTIDTINSLKNHQ